jgi:uncharacterized protein
MPAPNRCTSMLNLRPPSSIILSPLAFNVNYQANVLNWGVDKSFDCIYTENVQYIQFIWDDVKSRSNLRKHGISFEEAKTVFFDEDARLLHDPDHSEQEDRFILLGMSLKLRLLLVCHCYREGENLIRIISARKATKAESQRYGG